MMPRTDWSSPNIDELMKADGEQVQVGWRIQNMRREQMMRYLKRSKRQAIARGKEINISSKAFLANNCNPLEALEAERDEARQVARRLLRERDDARLTLATLCNMMIAEDAEDRSDDALVKSVGKLIRDWNEKNNDYASLERERDEAIRSRNMAQDERTAAMTEYLHIIRERDEARESKEAWHAVAIAIGNQRDEARRELSKATLWDDDNEEAWKNLSALCETQTATIQHLESDMDALATENLKLRAALELHRLALEQVEWERCHIPFKDDVWLQCPWCGGNGRHEPDCIRQAALGLAKGDIAPNTSLETQLRDEIERLTDRNKELESRYKYFQPSAEQWQKLLFSIMNLRACIEQVEWEVNERDDEYYCPWCNSAQQSGHLSDCRRQVALGLAKDGEWGLVYARLSDEVKSDAPCADDPTLL